MEPRTLQLRYTEAISGLITRCGAEPALVIVCDDVHWADEASVDCCCRWSRRVYACPCCGWSPVAQSATCRAGALGGSRGTRSATALVDLRLEPLEADDGERLVANLLAIDSLPVATRTMILARAEGNPLFVEEIVRMLIDREAIESRDGRWVATAKVVDVEIPETLHGLLLARIDRLPARHAASCASPRSSAAPSPSACSTRS